MDLGLIDQKFLVTGASSGLGFATAQHLVNEGASVVLVSRREEQLRAATQALGNNARYCVGDLGSPLTAESSVETVLSEFGAIDGALVSVGGPPRGLVLSMPDSAWTDAFDSVFLPAVRVAKAVFSANPSAVVVFVLSVSAKSPLPGLALSNALRPGLAMLVKQLADEVGRDGGRTVGLLPGSFATRRSRKLFAEGGDEAGARESMEASIPLGREGTPDEFGRVAAFMLSPTASYVTGSLLSVDGGLSRSL